MNSSRCGCGGCAGCGGCGGCGVGVRQQKQQQQYVRFHPAVPRFLFFPPPAQGKLPASYRRANILCADSFAYPLQAATQKPPEFHPHFSPLNCVSVCCVVLCE